MLVLVISFPFSGKARLVDKCLILNIKACAVEPIICPCPRFQSSRGDLRSLAATIVPQRLTVIKRFNLPL